LRACCTKNGAIHERWLLSQNTVSSTTSKNTCTSLPHFPSAPSLHASISAFHGVLLIPASIRHLYSGFPSPCIQRITALFSSLPCPYFHSYIILSTSTHRSGRSEVQAGTLQGIRKTIYPIHLPLTRTRCHVKSSIHFIYFHMQHSFFLFNLQQHGFVASINVQLFSHEEQHTRVELGFWFGTFIIGSF